MPPAPPPTPINLINVSYLSSIPMVSANPTRLAMDKAGVLYVANPLSGQILKFSQDGSPAGSINGFQKPLSVAVDDSGRVYVGDLKDGSVTVVNPEGQFLFSLGKGKGEFGMPGGIAIASTGSIYVTDSRNNVVKVYASGGLYQSSFGGYGIGNGQMIFPTGIALDNGAQEIYVVDHNNGRVKVFDFAGAFKRSLGSYGSGTGKLTRPQGIFVKDGLAYVADAFQSTVQVLDASSGTFVAYIGQNGSNPGNLRIPSDVLVTGQKAFVANTDNARIEVFQIQDPKALAINPSSLSFTADLGTNPAGQSVTVDSQASGTAVQWTTTISAPFSVTLSPSAGTTPTAVTVNVDTTGLALGSNTGTVNFRSAANNVDYSLTINLDVIQPPQLLVSPATVDFSHQVYTDLASQTLSIASSRGSLSWTATTNVNWLILSAPSGTTPGTITVSLNQDADLLSTGTYTGAVNFISNGVNYPIPVNLTVIKPQLSVSPASIALFHQINGDLASQTISITSIGGSVSWTAAKDVNWLSLPIGSGITPSTIAASLNQNADTLPEGLHTAAITVNAPGASPATISIPITLKVVQAGTITVKTNLDQALFTISGPAAYSGTGKTWSTNEAKPGVYTIQFGYVKGFRRPATRTFNVETGRSFVIDAQYQPIPVANVIAAAKGPNPKNDAFVRLLDLGGNLLAEFKALDTMFGARVAMGDVDGDGLDEIVVAPGPASGNQALIKVFRNNGSLLASTGPVPGTISGAAVAVGDMFGDGRSEIAVSMINTVTGNEEIVIYALDDNNRTLLEKKRLSFAINGSTYPSNLAFGDTNGDGILELIVVAGNGIDIYSFDTNYVASLIASGTVQITTLMPDYKSQMTVSAGDIDGSGIDEIILGLNYNSDSFVYVLKGDLTTYGLAFTAFANGNSSPALSSMDINGDGACEFLAGAGAFSKNGAVIRIYDSANVNQPKEITVFVNAVNGVNAAFGKR